MNQILIAALIPTLVVLIGILLNRQDAMAMRSEMGQLREEFKNENSQLRSEIKSEIAQLRAEIITLRDNIRRDMMGLHERVATVEARQPR